MAVMRNNHLLQWLYATTTGSCSITVRSVHWVQQTFHMISSSNTQSNTQAATCRHSNKEIIPIIFIENFLSELEVEWRVIPDGPIPTGIFHAKEPFPIPNHTLRKILAAVGKMILLRSEVS